LPLRIHRILRGERFLEAAKMTYQIHPKNVYIVSFFVEHVGYLYYLVSAERLAAELVAPEL